MWKRIAVVSILTNVALAAALIVDWATSTRVVRGELVVPKLDPAPVFEPEMQNTQLIGIETKAGYRSCRIPSLDFLTVMNETEFAYGDPPAVVEVEILNTKRGPTCTTLTTLSAGRIHTPK